MICGKRNFMLSEMNSPSQPPPLKRAKSVSFNLIDDFHLQLVTSDDILKLGNIDEIDICSENMYNIVNDSIIARKLAGQQCDTYAVNIINKLKHTLKTLRSDYKRSGVVMHSKFNINLFKEMQTQVVDELKDVTNEFGQFSGGDVTIIIENALIDQINIFIERSLSDNLCNIVDTSRMVLKTLTKKKKENNKCLNTFIKKMETILKRCRSKLCK
jgi:hypothetical protein